MTMASLVHILTLPVADPAPKQKGHVLVRASSSKTATDSPQPLDLDLVSTDDDKAYVINLQHGRVSRYRDPDGPYSDHEWEACLISLLRNKKPADDVHVTAHFKEKDYLTIEFRTNKASPQPKQPLGRLRLRRSHSAQGSIDLFDWCVEATAARDQLSRELADVKRRHEQLQELVAEETARFRELERSKREFETEHDSWLRDLLNEKKTKIRMQERILSTAHVDQTKLAAAAAKARVGGRKRKAEEGSSTEDEPERMDVDDDGESPKETSDVGTTTTQGSDTASSDAEQEPQPPKKKTSGGGGPSARTNTAARTAAAAAAAGVPKSNLRGNKDDTSLSASESEEPRKRQTRNKPPPAPDPADDESTASE